MHTPVLPAARPQELIPTSSTWRGSKSLYKLVLGSMMNAQVPVGTMDGKSGSAEWIGSARRAVTLVLVNRRMRMRSQASA